MALPNLQEIYDQLNRDGFDGSLPTVNLSWSKRMTSSGGTFRWKLSIGQSGAYWDYKITLSAPIFELHPSEAIHTLAHEMIHLWEHIECGQPSHGIRFQAKMRKLNKQLGLNITVKHSLEVKHNHVWSCDCGEAAFKRQRFDKRTDAKAKRCYCRKCHGRLIYRAV